MEVFMLNRSIVLLLIAVFSLAIFNGCEETTTPEETPLVSAPSNLKATSIDQSTVRLKFQASTDESKTYFKDYVLYISPGAFAPRSIPKGQTVVDVTGLTDGTIYTFEIKARNTDDKESLTSAQIQWSPAIRFTKNINDEPIRIYETASQFGSGLQLYDPASGKPKTLKVASGEFWNLGLYTKGTEQSLYTATYIANQNLYNFPVPPSATTEISEDIFQTNTLDNVFDSQALSANNFSSNYYIDLADSNYKNGVVLIARVKYPGQNEWNYAKVLILPGANGLLQGTPDNRYIECVISYQKTAGVPYAKTAN